MGGISVSGIALNVTGYAQVRFVLACQPCKGLQAPVNGLPTKAFLREEGGTRMRVERRTRIY